MSKDIAFSYNFHPVGQGLFGSGTLRPWQDQQLPFHWVFDCGSMAKKADWIQQVNWYRDLVLQENMLNLLCVSHFDMDHVSGLGELLDGIHVGTVVLPYITPIERLVLGCTQSGRRGRGGGIDEEYFAFLSNPVEFIIDRADRVDRILYIHRPPPDDPTWPYGDAGGDSPLRDLDDRPFQPHRQTVQNDNDRDGWHLKPWDVNQLGAPPGFAGGMTESAPNWSDPVWFVNETVELRAVAPSDKGYPSQWEFLFFHKPEPPETISRIVQEAEWVLADERAELDAQISLADALQNPKLRTKIRDVYRRAFGSGKKFNAASLCVYTGPLAETQIDFAISPPRIWHGIPPYFNNVFGRHWPWPERGLSASNLLPSVLYTGDANFMREANRLELRAFLKDHRWQRFIILQVPHHGSRDNWEAGSANEFPHAWSVFCADPQFRHHHPDREVILDLLGRNPLLVDRVAGVGFDGIALYDEHS